MSEIAEFLVDFETTRALHVFNQLAYFYHLKFRVNLSHKTHKKSSGDPSGDPLGLTLPLNGFLLPKLFFLPDDVPFMNEELFVHKSGPVQLVLIYGYLVGTCVGTQFRGGAGVVKLLGCVGCG